MKQPITIKFCNAIVIAILAFPLWSGCSSSTPESATADNDSPCVAGSQKSGSSILSNCRTGLILNSTDYGIVDWKYNINGFQGCDEFKTEGKLEGNEMSEPGTVRIDLNEASSNITFSSSSEGDITLLPSDKPDWLFVRTFNPGDSSPVEKEVYCEGLEDEALKIAQATGNADAKECAGDDPNADTTTTTFYCDELKAFIDGQQVKQNLSSKSPHHILAGHILTRETRAIVARHGSPKQAEVIAFIGVVVNALVTIFKSEEFKTLFNDDKKNEGAGSQGAWEGTSSDQQ